MEKVTSWRWRIAPQEPQREDSYWYDDINHELVVVRGDDDPLESKERIPAEQAMLCYSVKPYSKLSKHSQHAHDFLKARGY